MDASELLRQLCDSLTRSGLTVRQERLGGDGGGICKMRGQYTLFIDLDADPETQLQRSVECLNLLPNLDGIYLPPQIREKIDPS